MKTFLVCIVLSFFCFVNGTFSQCGMISLIGEFNSWAEDEFLDRDPSDPAEFSLILVLTVEDDFDGNGIIEMKFRENASWDYNYGSDQFPSGNAYLNGPNIPVPIGSYLITFNCNTLHYNFESTCGLISIIGEFSGWSGDLYMERDPANPDLWTYDLSLDAGDNQYDPPDIIDMKFRENADWMVNWGGLNFPSGIGVQDGANIPVPLTYSGITTDYHVSFNCSTGQYDFMETSGPISIIGEFDNWGTDLFMERNESNLNQYSRIISLTAEDDSNLDGIVELKFRENADWMVFWGSTQFPSGTAILDGPNIPVPLDNTGITTDYLVTFNYSTLAYNFQSTSGNIGIIGAFIGWNSDIAMNRNPLSPDNWTLTRRWTADSDLKFRENSDWSMNWGDDAFPSGTGQLNGPNIPLLAGTYDVSFNASTGAYNFVSNPDVCGEIGMVGDFNSWGGTGDYPLDLFLVRDPEYPNLFSLDYTFPESTDLLFRLDADPTFTDVWGGSSLCQTGVQDPSALIQVGGGNYHITFDYNSGDYCLESQGNSLTAPRVYSIIIDGVLDETEWDISQPVSKIIQGTLSYDPNYVQFGAAYDDNYLYIGLQVIDAVLYIDDNNEFFVDGDNSGGAYDEHDVHFLAAGPEITVITGPPGGITIESAILVNTDGYTLELAIPFAALGVFPVEGDIIGFDMISWDDDSGTIDYKLAWNGTVDNFNTTSNFGDIIFGPQQCGNISMFNVNIGDVILQPLTNDPNTFVATYEFDNDFDVFFRRNKNYGLMWGSENFPSGTAILGGPPIPAVTGRYRITFNCVTGDYVFSEDPVAEDVAKAYFIDYMPSIDAALDEYDLVYNSNILVDGTGPINNIVQWGARWDMGNVYIGATVIDAAVIGNGSPWDNDAIELYIDGNNDKDGPYDLDFDTQIIMDAWNEAYPWFKADGVAITNYSAAWANTGLGYNIELRLGWDNFAFEPGRGRVMGWSLGNDDDDDENVLGRDYQSVWYGNGENWNNTSVMGDLQLADGPYAGIRESLTQDDVVIYPNPSGGSVAISFRNNNAGEQLLVSVFDFSGRSMLTNQIILSGENDLLQLNLEDALPGLYFVRICSGDGQCILKKLVIQ